MASSSSSCGGDQDLAFLIVQFLDEHNFTESARMLEKEGKLYFSMTYVAKAVAEGKWKELEAYILRFTKIDDNTYSLKMILEIRRQKYIEALDNDQYANALEILKNELEVLAPYDQDILYEMEELRHLNNVRQNKRLGIHITDTETSRRSVFAHLQLMIKNNPVFKDKLNYPSLEEYSRLKVLMNHSLNWQHKMCKYPKLNPTVSTLYVDHTCGDASVLSLDSEDGRASANLAPSNTDESEMPNIPDLNKQAQLYSLRLPDPVLSHRIDRITYTNSDAILALSCSGVFKFWKWVAEKDNPTGKATLRVVPPMFLANSDISLGENVIFVPYFALSKNDAYVASVSAGKVSLFSWVASKFKMVDTTISVPPVATAIMFYPEDNNIIYIGMEDGSIVMYHVRKEVIAKIHAHRMRVTGLAYSTALNMLVSSGYNAQVCVWNKFGWVKQSCKFLEDHGIPVSPGHTSVKFHQDQTHLLAIHESCIATFEGPNLERCKQWIPGQPIGDAAYSCDGQSIYACFINRHIAVLDSASFTMRFLIHPCAYLPSTPSPLVYPSALAAHPTEPNQFALGLTDGGVLVVELQEGDCQASTSQLENVAA